MSSVSSQTAICIAISVPSSVAYVLVLTQLIRKNIAGRRKKIRSAFYTLQIAQGVFDLLTQLVYLISVFRWVPPLNKFWYSLRDYYIPEMTYVHIYLFLYLRVVGVVCLSLQRFLAICFTQSALNKLLDALPALLILFAEILIAVLFALPVFFCDGYFVDDVTLATKMIYFSLTGNTNTAAIIIFSAMGICTGCYVSILRHVKQFRKGSESSFRNELKISLQLSGLLFGFTLIFIHYVAMIIIQATGNDQKLLAIFRDNYQIWSTIFSFTSPWLILIINRNIRQSFFCFKCTIERRRQPTESLSTVSRTRTQ